jgi:hypothetical protein
MRKKQVDDYGDKPMHPYPNHKELHSHHGTVRDVFGHRFVIITDDGPVLADVGSHAPDSVKLKLGAKVKITGERTPCEIKVRLFQSGKHEAIEIPYQQKKHKRGEDGDPTAAVKVALDAGYIVVGEPKRKQKHFELHAIRGGHNYALHIMLNGDIRKEIPLPK